MLQVYKRFFVSSIQRELEFKANFFANVAQNILWIAFFVLLLKIVYTNTSNVAGWSEGDSYVLAATVFFTYALLIVFFSVNLMEIPEKVRKGTLDFDLLKPVDSQFLVSIRKFSFDEIGTILGGVVMLFVGLSLNGYSPSFLQVIVYVAMVGCAVVIFYSFQLIMMTLAIWLVRVDNLWVLGETVYYVARFPTDIFRTQLTDRVHRQRTDQGTFGAHIVERALVCRSVDGCISGDQPSILALRRKPIFQRQQLATGMLNPCPQ